MQPVNSHHSKRVSAGTIAAGNALELAAGATTASARTGLVEKRQRRCNRRCTPQNRFRSL